MAASKQFLEPKLLSGTSVALEPYAPKLRDEVQMALDCDPEAWDLFASSGEGEHFRGWWSNAIAGLAAGSQISFAVRRLDDQQVVGSSSFLNIRADRQVVEIGATFYQPGARGTVINPEAKLLMLGYAFECGARRVELITDARNARSRAAIAKLGALEEGILRRDRVTWTGHIRDSVVFSVIDLDWPEVREGLQARLDS